jgi:hypothetical protein
MMLRYVVLSQVPEIRLDPSPPDREVTEFEVYMPVDIYWSLDAIIQEIRYCKSAGVTSNKQVQKFYQIIKNYIVGEKERMNFIKATEK